MSSAEKPAFRPFAGRNWEGGSSPLGTYQIHIPHPVNYNSKEGLGLTPFSFLTGSISLHDAVRAHCQRNAGLGRDHLRQALYPLRAGTSV
jgi:hypothetical protein